MRRVHHHPCAVCGAHVECPGEWEQDDALTPFCAEYRQAGADFTCDACEALTDDEREARQTPWAV